MSEAIDKSYAAVAKAKAAMDGAEIDPRTGLVSAQADLEFMRQLRVADTMASISRAEALERIADLMTPKAPDALDEGYIPPALEPYLPQPGSKWIWEPDQPHARVRVEVTVLSWNGEEVWIKAKSHDDERDQIYVNWSRWLEATVMDGEQ